MALIVRLATLFSLCSFLLAPPTACATAIDLSAKPGYQIFTLDGSRRNTRVEQLASTLESLAPGTWGVDVIHRDSLPSMKPRSFSNRDVAVMEMLKRDAARVEAITQRLEVAKVGGNTAQWKALKESMATNFDSPVVSGMWQGSGEYFTRFGLGSPPNQFYFSMDTGSDVSWTQCQPCVVCYDQSDPVFDPAASSSYQSVTCDSDLCSQLRVKGCHSNKCLYGVEYGDGSFTVGDFALETFTFEGYQVNQVAMGCGYRNEGLFVGSAGLLGLGGGRLSFPSQIKSEFSYCLPATFSHNSGFLLFSARAPRSSRFTSLLKNPTLDTFYYIELQGISVGGARLNISPSVFKLENNGDGGVILDSGTTLTYLVAPAYAALREAFVAGTSELPSASSYEVLDTCYALKGIQSVAVPTVELHMAGGTTLYLPPANYLMSVDSDGTYCLSFASSNSHMSIIGNQQQQGYRISFSSATARVGFAANQC